MSNDDPGTSVPILKPTLTFFNKKLSDINDKRFQWNRSKGLAKYLAQSKKNIRDITPLDTTLGIMSFSVYMLRFSTNVGLLMHLILVKPQDKSHHKKDLYYSLLNDGLWCVVNLTQFFWLSYQNSPSAGLRGMQLETLAQLVDLLVLIIRYQQDKREYDLKYSQATDVEQARLAIEWRHKELNMLRALLTGFSIAMAFGLFSFSIMTVPLSPIISIIILISSMLRILNDIEKDQQLINQLKLNGANSQQISNEERVMTCARLQDVNQVIFNSVFLPLGLFLLLTIPIPLTITIGASMVLIHYLIAHLINTAYLSNEPESTPLAP